MTVTWGFIQSFNERLGGLEWFNRQKKGRETAWDWDRFRVAPSCPPDKRLHVRGGLTYASPGAWGYDFSYLAWDIPNLTADLEDEDQVGVDITFATADYYLSYVLILLIPDPPEDPSPSDWIFNLKGSGTEYATAAEAEDDLVSHMAAQTVWPDPGVEDSGSPLCGLVLHNDGTTGAGCHILPVDPINRGRSYMWPTDLRPRWVMTQ